MYPVFFLATSDVSFLTGAAEVIAVTLISFVIITLISSYYRFQHIVEVAEKVQPEDMGADPIDILRIQIARFLANCARENTSFTLALLRFNLPGVKIRLDGPVVLKLRENLRRKDVICVYDDQTVGILTENEPDDSPIIQRRLINWLKSELPEFAEQDIRSGMATYPGHALSGIEMLSVAESALQKTTPQEPILLPEMNEYNVMREENAQQESDTETADASEESKNRSGGRSSRRSSKKSSRKDSILDELTGVLKPNAISPYMQPMLANIRQKKKRAALFAIGVNNIDHIARFHGENAATDVLVSMSHLIQNNLRTEDIIGRHERNAFLVLAEATLVEAEGIAKRLSTLASHHVVETSGKKLKTNLIIGVAAYPEHGRNLHQLYRAAQKVLDFNRTNDIRAYAVYAPEIHNKVPSKPFRSIKASKV